MVTDKKTESKPDIFGYFDYRPFLNALFEFNKARNAAFSHRYIVNRAGFTSPNALKNVMDGKRNLTSLAAEKFATAFRLEESEKRYFLCLVQFTQAKGIAEREKLLRELFDLQAVEHPARLAEARFRVLSQWWHLAIREIVSLPDFRNSTKWIANSLVPSITPAQAAESLSLLKDLGLICKTDTGWVPSDKTLATNPRISSIPAAEFHREMIRLGGESLSRFPAAEREISGTTLRLGKGEVETLKLLLREFRIKTLNLAARSRESDQVYQLNFQLFPLVRTSRPKRLGEAEV